MRILVTGGAGFIGSTITRQLLDKGQTVTVMDNLWRKGVEKNLKRIPEAKFILGDIRDTSKFEGEYDIIIHTAANAGIPYSLENPVIDFKINALGTLNVLEYARRNDSGVIYCSSNKVYSPDLFEDCTILYEKRYKWLFQESFPQNEDVMMKTGGRWHSPYGVSKLAGDLYCQEYGSTYGLDVIVNRMSCIYGNYQYGTEEQGWLAWFVTANLTNEPVTIYGDGKQVRDVLWCEDCADLYTRQVFDMKKWKGVWSVGGGKENTLSLLEALNIIERLSGKKFKEIKYDDWRPADQKVFITNISPLMKMGWRPETTPGEGINKMIEWQRKERFGDKNVRKGI